MVNTNVVTCMIYFKDTPLSTEEVDIKLSHDVIEEEDDSIFYYCNGLHEISRLMDEDNGEDFVVTSYQY